MPKTDDGWETSEYEERYDPEAERVHGPTGELETLYEEGSDREIRLTVDEAEDFERCEDTCLPASDTLSKGEFERVLGWLEKEEL